MRGSEACTLLLAACLSMSASPNAAVERGDSESAVTRALREVSALKEEESLGQTAERVQGIVDRATRALDAGHEELALALAVGPLDLGEAFIYQAAHREEASELDAFHALWKNNAGTLEAALDGMGRGVCQGASSQVRSIAERGLNQAALYYRAADATARASGAEAGLFYVGRARGKLNLKRFCKNSRSDAESPALRVTESMILDLERQTIVEFEKSSGGVEQHGRFISLNALIKELRELRGAGLRFGTADAYLDARLLLAELRDTPAALEELTPLLHEITARLSASTRDESIVTPLIQRAAEFLEAEELEENSLRTASAILRDVVPTYFKLLSPE